MWHLLPGASVLYVSIVFTFNFGMSSWNSSFFISHMYWPFSGAVGCAQKYSSCTYGNALSEMEYFSFDLKHLNISSYLGTYPLSRQHILAPRQSISNHHCKRSLRDGLVSFVSFRHFYTRTHIQTPKYSEPYKTSSHFCASIGEIRHIYVQSHCISIGNFVWPNRIRRFGSLLWKCACHEAGWKVGRDWTAFRFDIDCVQMVNWFCMIKVRAAQPKCRLSLYERLHLFDVDTLYTDDDVCRLLIIAIFSANEKKEWSWHRKTICNWIVGIAYLWFIKLDRLIVFRCDGREIIIFCVPL